jgi:predicted HNH restriction endonuclease
VEAKKCILVCANCHRGIHHEDLVVPNNWQKFFDEEIAKQIL